MSKPELVSVLLDRSIYRSKSQVKKALATRGLTSAHGIVEQSDRYWRVPQKPENARLDDASFSTGPRVRGMRAIRARRTS